MPDRTKPGDKLMSKDEVLAALGIKYAVLERGMKKGIYPRYAKRVHSNGFPSRSKTYWIAAEIEEALGRRKEHKKS